jgi:hypothetical protein
MEFRCRLTSADIATLTVSLGMHTVGDEKLETTNDAQMTRRVSRVIMHNGYITIIKNKPVSVMYNSVIVDDFFFCFSVDYVFIHGNVTTIFSKLLYSESIIHYF